VGGSTSFILESFISVRRSAIVSAIGGFAKPLNWTYGGHSDIQAKNGMGVRRKARTPIPFFALFFLLCVSLNLLCFLQP
jgi:hypothetical protein